MGQVRGSRLRPPTEGPGVPPLLGRGSGSPAEKGSSVFAQVGAGALPELAGAPSSAQPLPRRALCSDARRDFLRRWSGRGRWVPGA